MRIETQQSFTDNAHNALTFAQEEAKRLNHQTLCDEDILIGLVRARESTAGQLLYRLGLEVEPTRSMVKRLTSVRELPNEPTSKLAASTKQILEDALKDAINTKNKLIGTGHLLLAISKGKQSVSIDTLRHFGISPDRLQYYQDELIGQLR